MRCAYRMSKRHTTVNDQLNPRALMIIAFDINPRMRTLDQKVPFVVDKTINAAKSSNSLDTADKKQKVDTMQSPKAAGNKRASQRYTHTDSATTITIADTSTTSISTLRLPAVPLPAPTHKSIPTTTSPPLPQRQHTASTTCVHDDKYHC